MFQEVEDLKAEGIALQALLAGLGSADWSRPTPFKHWTPWDVVAHLHLSDQWAVASLQGPQAFRQAIAPLLAALNARKSMATYTREHFSDLPGASILDSWRRCFDDLNARLADLDPKTRLTWFGPDMGGRSFVTARYMETWSHGQDIHDLLGQPRVYNDAIRAIATLGVKTYGFTFSNRRLPAPKPEPHVWLTAPSGAIWEWNPPSDNHRVEGLASDFCHVVTQGRNIADTSLIVIGEPAQQWMAIAQCFAGPPETPPAPGTRLLSSAR